MSAARLPVGALEALRAVFARHPEIAEVVLFGSRAKGTERPESDVDLGVRGVASERAIEALADELDELPLPFLFDVKAIETIKNAALAEHVRRVGMVIYERGRPANG